MSSISRLFLLNLTKNNAVEIALMDSSMLTYEHKFLFAQLMIVYVQVHRRIKAMARFRALCLVGEFSQVNCSLCVPCFLISCLRNFVYFILLAEVFATS